MSFLFAKITDDVFGPNRRIIPLAFFVDLAWFCIAGDGSFVNRGKKLVLSFVVRKGNYTQFNNSFTSLPLQ